MPITKLAPYVNLDGTAEQAINLYKRVLGAEVESLARFGDVPGMKVAPEHKTRVINAVLRIGAGILMISDSQPGMPLAKDSNVHVSLDFDDLAQMTKSFEALSAGGKITLPLQDTFWGAKLGMLTDAYGIRWMLSTNVKKG